MSLITKKIVFLFFHTFSLWTGFWAGPAFCQLSIRKVLSVKKLLDAQNNTFGEESEQTTKLNFKKNSVDDAWTAHTRCESGVQRGELTLLANGVALLSFNLFILAGQNFPNNKA